MSFVLRLRRFVDRSVLTPPPPLLTNEAAPGWRCAPGMPSRLLSVGLPLLLAPPSAANTLSEAWYPPVFCLTECDNGYACNYCLMRETSCGPLCAATAASSIGNRPVDLARVALRILTPTEPSPVPSAGPRVTQPGSMKTTGSVAVGARPLTTRLAPTVHAATASLMATRVGRVRASRTAASTARGTRSTSGVRAPSLRTSLRSSLTASTEARRAALSWTWPDSPALEQ